MTTVDSIRPVVSTVVIPNWNGKHLLGPCLQALALQSYREFEVIVVDNGSDDGSRDFLFCNHPKIRVIANDTNRGFAVAVNQGIRASSGRFVILLNNDTVVDVDWFGALISAAETAPDVGMCASKMILTNHVQVIDSAGICVDRLGFAWDRLGGQPDDPSDDEVMEVFGPSAGAALYRREMLDQIGFFDEDFFAYLEDVDLAWRARAAGWRCLYVPQARVHHIHSATSREGSPFKSYHLGRNKIWLLVKNYPLSRLWPYVPLVLLYDLLAVGYGLWARRDLAALKGRIVGWLNAPKMWRKRNDTRRGSRADVPWLESIRWPWQIQDDLAYLKRLRT